MVDRRIIEEWLAKADEDFGFASSLLDESPYYAQLCFHYQQAAEKYLKAFIVAHELEFRKIHDLLDLLDICHMKDASLYEIKDACIFLKAFYIDTRYPVHWPTSYTKDDALKARDEAARIQKAIKSAVT